MSRTGSKLLFTTSTGALTTGFSASFAGGGTDLVLKVRPAYTKPATAMSEMGSAILTSYPHFY